MSILFLYKKQISRSSITQYSIAYYYLSLGYITDQGFSPVGLWPEPRFMELYIYDGDWGAAQVCMTRRFLLFLCHWF